MSDLLPLPEPDETDDSYRDLYGPSSMFEYARANMAPLTAERDKLRAVLQACELRFTFLAQESVNVVAELKQCRAALNPVSEK